MRNGCVCAPPCVFFLISFALPGGKHSASIWGFKIIVCEFIFTSDAVKEKENLEVGSSVRCRRWGRRKPPCIEHFSGVSLFFLFNKININIIYFYCHQWSLKKSWSPCLILFFKINHTISRWYCDHNTLILSNNQDPRPSFPFILHTDWKKHRDTHTRFVSEEASLPTLLSNWKLKLLKRW